MKKKNLSTALKLKKNTISNLAKIEAIGGSRGCSQTMCGSCSCPEACLDLDRTKDATKCKCL